MDTQGYTTVSEYLRKRGLSFDPTVVEQDPILDSPELTKEASELWTSKENLIRLIIQARVNAIGKHMLDKAIPEEVLVLRQALVEIGALVDDFAKYKGEHGRQTVAKTKEEDNTEAEQPDTSPPEGEEGSL